MSRLKRNILFIQSSLEARINTLGHKHRCYLCNNTFNHFDSYQGGSESRSPFIKNLKIIGSDLDNFSCPMCGCHDRERHLAMYFDHLQLWECIKDARLLHFAPEKNLSEFIVKNHPKLYIQADLQSVKPEILKIDATQIPFCENSFDFILFCHILEHISNDKQVLAELFRLLKPGGFAVLQTPFSAILFNSFSDPAINTPRLRRIFYGQEDHVRIYGQNLFSKIIEAGFTLNLNQHQELMMDSDATYYGVNPEEPLILATKCAG